jgi:hypothetical protein
MCLILVVVCLSPGPGSAIIFNGQRQKTDIKLLDRGEDQQCASVEQKQRARNEIHEITHSAIAATIALITMPNETATSDSAISTT